VDIVVAAYNVFLLVLWFPLALREPVAAWMVGAHLLALTLPGLLFISSRQHPAVAVLRELYPLLWLMAFWGELGEHYAVTGSALGDALLAGTDQFLLGGHLNAWWMPAMPQVWFSEVLHAFYFGYYPLVAGVLIVVFAQGDTAARRDVVLRFTAAFLACFVFYAAIPTLGPLHTLPRYSGPLVQGWFYRLTHLAREGGDALGTAFPSSHVCCAVTAAWCARRYFGGWFGRLAVVSAAMIALATVYTQNHFVLDAAAGGGLGLFLQYRAIPWVTTLPAELLSWYQRLVPVAGTDRAFEADRAA
jgi:hypothetical protein